MKIFVKSFYNFKIIGEQVVIFNKWFIFKIVWCSREKTLYYLLCLLRSNSNSMVFLVSLNKLTHLFLCLLYDFLSLLNLLLRNFFLSFDLTITAHWISLFMKGAWFFRINLLFKGAFVFTTDKQVSLKCFRPLSLICKSSSVYLVLDL